MSNVNDNLTSRSLIAVLLIAVGVMAMMGMGLLWPLFILVPGLVMIALARAGQVQAAVFGIPGALVTGTGALLLVQNLTGYWTSWSYAWTLYGAFTGWGLMRMGKQLDGNLTTIGRVMAQWSMVAFVAAAIFFEAIIGVSGGIGPMGALLLIGLGLHLLRGDGPRPCSLLFSDKRKAKPKRKRDQPFTGPMMVGSRASERELEAWRARQGQPGGPASEQTDA
jgi:hypothetical protein